MQSELSDAPKSIVVGAVGEKIQLQKKKTQSGENLKSGESS